MRKLNNTLGDCNYLESLIKKETKVKAIIDTGIFLNTKSNIETHSHEGYIIYIDVQTGYCKWENLIGDKMPFVNINCVTLV